MMNKLFLLALLLPLFSSAKSTPDSLVVLDLQHKNLSTLPNAIQFSKIGTLHLGYNAFVEIPKELIAAKNLNYLSMNFAKNLNLEASLNTIKQLHIETLSLNNSNLIYFPLEFGESKTLRNLYLKNNFIKTIPEYILIHGDFSSLDLDGNQISELPKEIKNQQNLNFLDLSQNTCINNSSTYQNLNLLPNLSELNIRGAKTLPFTLWDLNKLQKLDISEGVFTSVTTNTTNANHSLQILKVQDCNLFDFKTLQPILQSNSLKEITLGGSNFNGFENVSLSTNVTYLNLSGDNLAHFTLSNTLTNLESLILNFKTISCESELLKTLTGCANLTSLNLSQCQISRLPIQIFHLKRLQTLNLSNNKLQSIIELFQLKQLQTLDVSMCELTKDQVEKIKKELPNTEIICNQSYGKIPLANSATNTESFSVLPTNPQEIVTQNGTKIFIPKNSLVYANGKPVKENVTINFTPMYNLAEIATSGINMNYEENGTSAPFSSAGMFNLSASVAGTSVELKTGNEIKVDFKSNDASQSYNYYIYDSIKRTWKTIGNDSIKKIRVTKDKDTINVIKNLRVNNSNSVMPQPQIYYKNHPIHIYWNINKNKVYDGTFQMTANIGKWKDVKDTAKRDNYFYELEGIKKITWKLVSTNTKKSIKTFSFDNKLMTYEPEFRRFKLKPRYISSEIRKDKYVEFDIIPNRESDDFVFRFYDIIDTVEFHAYPIISNRSTDRTQKAIKKLYFNYEAKSNERKVITKYRKQKFEDAYKNFKINNANSRNNIFSYQEKNLDELLEERVKTNLYDITRVLTLRGFGIYNCDRPIPYENPIVFNGNFINEKGNHIGSGNIQLVDARLNISQTFYNNTNLKVSKNSIITVILTANSGGVYVGKISTFDAKKNEGKLTVQLSNLDPKATINDLNDFINLTY